MDTHRAMAFVAQHQRGVLLTLKGDGRPQASNIVYATMDGDHEVWISVTASRAKTRNLARDPRASLHVTNDDFSQWVVVEGNVLLSPVATSPDDAVADDLVEYYRTLRGEHPDWDEYRQAMVDDQRQVVHLRPDHAYGQLAD